MKVLVDIVAELKNKEVISLNKSYWRGSTRETISEYVQEACNSLMRGNYSKYTQIYYKVY